MKVYMDDIVVHAKGVKNHEELIREVLNRFKVVKMKVNPAKMQYRLRRVKIVGSDSQ